MFLFQRTYELFFILAGCTNVKANHTKLDNEENTVEIKKIIPVENRNDDGEEHQRQKFMVIKERKIAGDNVDKTENGLIIERTGEGKLEIEKDGKFIEMKRAEHPDRKGTQ